MTHRHDTELLLGARDETPAVCGVCSRKASSVGVLDPPGQNVLWLCETCTPKDGLKVAGMNPAKLSETEAAALGEAASQMADGIAACVLRCLWEEGIRDLDAVDGTCWPAILARLAADEDYRKAIRRLFLAYTLDLRTRLANTPDA